MKQSRRHLLKLSGGLAVCAIASPAVAKLVSPIGLVQRDIEMNHLHTSEQIGLVFAVDYQYVDPALNKLNYFLRDHYSNDVGVMDPALYDFMYQIRRDLSARRSYEIISGYRSPKTNEHLRTSRGGGVARRSLHMDGKAIDLRLPGVPLAELRDAAIAQEMGGVGYYSRDGFVHIDTGRVRTWGS
jgi:uncharacterized protein YcbK (DUF882 family)